MKTKYFVRFLRAVAHRPLPFALRMRLRTRAREIEFAAELEAARNAGSGAEIEELLAGKHAEDYFDYEDGEINFTRRLVAEAARLRVPVPERPSHTRSFADQIGNEWWEFSTQLGEFYLSSAGVRALRRSIREEKDARSSARNQWVVWMSALTGLIGTVTGLIAILLSAQ